MINFPGSFVNQTLPSLPSATREARMAPPPTVVVVVVTAEAFPVGGKMTGWPVLTGSMKDRPVTAWGRGAG